MIDGWITIQVKGPGNRWTNVKAEGNADVFLSDDVGVANEMIPHLVPMNPDGTMPEVRLAHYTN